MGVAFALCASATWGVGDFLGGLATRARSAILVMAVSQPAGLVALAIATLALAGAARRRGRMGVPGRAPGSLRARRLLPGDGDRLDQRRRPDRRRRRGDSGRRGTARRRSSVDA